jgi:plasmid maintenance system antidote protein VapI
MRAKGAPYKVVARRDVIHRLAKTKLEKYTDQALAAHLDLHPATLCALLKGHRSPSAEVIALFVTKFGEPFDRLFAIEHVPPMETDLAIAA